MSGTVKANEQIEALRETTGGIRHEPPQDELALPANGEESNGVSKEFLFDEFDDSWKKEWAGMPEYSHEDQEPWKSVTVHFECEEDMRLFSMLVEQKMYETTRSIWYPEAEIGRFRDKRYVDSDGVTKNPRHPVYVISKGRWETRLTSKALEKIRVPYRIVVEPQERDEYAKVIDPAKILVLPFSNLGQGSIPARNWVWEHSISEGHTHHWILDDNIDGFYRYNRNLKTPVASGTIFRCAEDFVDRYENVALSGFQYFMFVARKSLVPPYLLNTRIYSCILIRNDLTHRWRGKYNEDTDLSIRVLKDGWCTILFQAFLCGKQTTMSMKGGNTDELYTADDGRLKMAESLVEQHPDITKITWKWGRWQHHVNYGAFKRNRLRLKPGFSKPAGLNDYGMKLHIDGVTP